MTTPTRRIYIDDKLVETTGFHDQGVIGYLPELQARVARFVAEGWTAA